MYNEIEYELNYIADTLKYVRDIHGFIKARLNTILSEMRDLF